jgi:hypothetical protein
VTRTSIDHDLRRAPRRLLTGGAFLLAAVTLAACGSAASPSAAPISPSPSASPSESPSPSASASSSASETASASPTASSSAAAGADCQATNLRASSTGWSGAAGTRGADVTVENTGSTACNLPTDPVVAVVDSTEAVLVQSASAVSNGGPSIGSTGTATFVVRFSNWCDRTITFPVNVQLVLTAGTVEVSGLTSTKLDDMPPCNGPGQSPSLSTLAWGQR